MFWLLKLVLHFHIFIIRPPDTEQTQGTRFQWKAQSIMSKTSSALTKPSASLFHHHPPTSLFFSRALSRPLVSSSVGQSVCSEVFISAAGLPSCRRDKRLFKTLRFSPSSQQNSSCSPKTSPLSPTALSSMYLVVLLQPSSVPIAPLLPSLAIHPALSLYLLC